MGGRSNQAGAGTIDAGAADRALPRTRKCPLGGVPDRPGDREPLAPIGLAREICEQGGWGRRCSGRDRARRSALFEAGTRRPLTSAAVLFARLMELFSL